ncbi:MAG: phosphoglycerate mutase, partial [Methanosarcinales archaeon]|nr:phosphoglycerate mutase [Methanosarcinales archaeon]
MPQTITDSPKPQVIALLLLVLLLPCQACATTEITVNNADYDGCVLLVLDGLGSAYCYPELTPRALDNSTLRKADCANILAIAENGTRVIDVRAPVTSTGPGHSVIVTGRRGATPNKVSGTTTIFDIAHENGYFCAGVMENGDF